jgi:hypothetical protein
MNINKYIFIERFMKLNYNYIKEKKIKKSNFWINKMKIYSLN